MEIFKDSPDLFDSNLDFQYNQIILNQVTYNPKNEQKKKDFSKEEQTKDTSLELSQEVLIFNLNYFTLLLLIKVKW